MKRTIEIEDSLQERVDDCKTEVLDAFREYIQENPDIAEFSEFQDALSCNGRDHEIVDSSTPIYYSDIDGIYYLYGDELEECYRNHGLGDGSEENHRQVTIYCWLTDAVWEALREIEEWFEIFQADSMLNNETVKKAALLDAVENLELFNS